jgi:hypothetical protein
MALKAVLTKAEHDALPDPLKEHYVAKDDAFILEADGVERLDEFRTNNRRLNSELEQARARLKAYDGIDPQEYGRLKAEVERLTKAPVKDDKELEERIERVTAPLKQSVKQLQDERDALKRQNEEQTFQTHVTSVAQKIGILNEFMPDVLSRATRAGFRLADGEVRGFRGGTDDPLRADDGKEVTLERFMREQPAAFFGTTKGSNNAPGARPGSGANSGAAVKKLYNPSPAELGRLSKEIAAGTVEVVRDQQP